MDKCCDNCKLKIVGCTQPMPFKDNVNWDTSKDFCSKWEEERINQILIDYYKRLQEKNKWCNSRNVIEPSEEKLVKYFKQRIEESLAIIEEKYNARPMSDDLKLSDVIKEFEWIL